MFSQESDNKKMLFGAYKKLKSYYHYNKNFLLMRKKIASFEFDSEKMNLTLDFLAKIMKNPFDYSDKINDWINSIDYYVLPKAFKENRNIEDRFVLSSLAYQGGGRELGVEDVRKINDFAINGVNPDMIIFFYVDPLTTLKRKSLNVDADRLELSGDDFHSRVYDTYMELLEKMKDEKVLKKVDATKSMSEVFEDVKNIIDEKLEELLWKW